MGTMAYNGIVDVDITEGPDITSLRYSSLIHSSLFIREYVKHVTNAVDYIL
jgi:hypothetical protein